MKERIQLSKLRANLALYMNKIPFFAALLGLLGVSLGAFGAHALKETLIQNGTTSTWETAVFYHLIHALVAWTVIFSPTKLRKLAYRAAAYWVAGVIIFSGSLYLLALDGPRWLGPITPIGGLLLIIGWAFAAKCAWMTTTDSDQ